MAATSLRLEMLVGRRPTVARVSEPWALVRNPVGIPTGKTQCFTSKPQAEETRKRFAPNVR